MADPIHGASANADRAGGPTDLSRNASQPEALIPSAGWWHTQNEEYLYSRCDTRDAAIDAGIWEYGGEPFLICQGERFKYQALHFDIDRIAEDFDDANSEYGPEDEGPSASWSSAACRELESALTATMEAWLDKHGYRDAWAIDARGYEPITAQAIEARRAGTGTGSVHESAVGNADAPESASLRALQHQETGHG